MCRWLKIKNPLHLISYFAPMNRLYFLLFYCFLILCPVLLLAQTPIDPQDVTIIRDQWGVPHIYGNTDADAAYGLAWAHCE